MSVQETQEVLPEEVPTEFPGLAGPEPYAPEEEAIVNELSLHQRLALGRVLLETMKDLAEKHLGSRWLAGADRLLWDLAQGNDVPEMEVEELDVQVATTPSDLLVLAELAGGWWSWDEEAVFVPLHQWREEAALEKHVDQEAE